MSWFLLLLLEKAYQLSEEWSMVYEEVTQNKYEEAKILDYYSNYKFHDPSQIIACPSYIYIYVLTYQVYSPKNIYWCLSKYLY